MKPKSRYANLATSRILIVGALVSLLGGSAFAQSGFFSMPGKAKAETVTLVTQLPPIAVPAGKTVQLVTTMAGRTMQPEAAELLKQQIRTLLLGSKGANLQLVDGPADTVIRCIVTSYEPKVVHQGTRQQGTASEQISTWEGTIEVSVQVEDRLGNPIDAANLKYHLENDYVVARKEGKIGSVFGKATKSTKAAEILNIAHGGNAGEVAQAAGGNSSLGQALNVSQAKDAPPPTDLEWRNALIEGMASKVANQIVPVDQAIIAILPGGKDFAEMRTLAVAGHWGEVQENAEKMPQQKPDIEAYRLYMLGLSYEALANSDPKKPQQAADMLNKSTKDYGDAHVLRPEDHQLVLAQLRAQDSLDHYLEVQHYNETKAAEAPAQKANPPASSASSGDNAADNGALIAMVKSKMPDSVIMTFVQTAPNPKFDTSAQGLMALSHAEVPGKIIEAVQKRMSATAAPHTTRTRRARPTQ